MMGMSNTMFWWSWFFTHWLSAMISVVLITLVGIYPFSYTNQFIQFIFYTFWVASLTLWNFWISTFFSKSITATIVGCFAYVLTMVPSIAVRITQPEGSGAWILACIFPSGAMNMWGAALAILEVNKKGITMETFNEDVTLKGNVTCAGILGMVIFDCLFYAFLTFYFDAVWKPNTARASLLGFYSRVSTGAVTRRRSSMMKRLECTSKSLGTPSSRSRSNR